MAQPLIVSRAEIVAELGLGTTATDADLGLIESIQRRVENACRRFCRHNITQPATDYVEFHPRVSRTADVDSAQYVEIVGNKASWGGGSSYANVLQLDQMFVRSITEVREDFDARFGQGDDDFPSGSVLTAGTDYYLQLDSTGLGKAGHLVRRNNSWSLQAGTVKVTYMAGLTAAELDDEYSDIKDAVIEEIALRWNRAKSVRGGAVGPIKSESMGGQVSFTYATEAVGTDALSKPVKQKLWKFVRLPL